MRQILITAVVSHMDDHEIIAIFVVNESPPLWGRVRVGAADNSSAGLGFYRVVVQVMVWKEVYFFQNPVVGHCRGTKL